MQQRISRRFRLEPLNRDEVSQYIEHRLAVVREGQPGSDVGSQIPGATELARALAEWSGPGEGVAFSPDAIDAILLSSGGLPRVINLLCDRSLEEAYRARVRGVDATIVGLAATALSLAGSA